MKKLAIIIGAVCLTIILIVCLIVGIIRLFATDKYIMQCDVSLNYNNAINYMPNSFWLNRDFAVYQKSFGRAAFAYYADKNGTSKIATSKPLTGVIPQVYDNIAYFLTYIESIDPENSLYYLEACDLTNDKRVEIGHFNNVNYYFIHNNHVYLWTYYWETTDEGDDYTFYKLDSINIETLESTTVCDRALSAGVMGDTVVYITAANEEESIIYSYNSDNDEHTEIGRYTYKSVDEQQYIQYNFTSDKIVFWESNYDGTQTYISTYDINENCVTATYEVDGYINTFVAFENNAYFTTYDMESDYDDITYCLNCIDLTTGEVDVWDSANHDFEIFVVSDKDVYVRGYTPWAKIYHYTENSKKEPLF